jgi:imidazolonepropionase
MTTLIHNIGQLVTPRGTQAIRGRAMQELEVISHAAILVENGIITRIGNSDTLRHTAEIGLKLVHDDSTTHENASTKSAVQKLEVEFFDARGTVALPGFVDSHTHTVFAGNRAHEFALRAAGKTYQEIAASGGGILSTMNATRTASEQELIRLGAERLDAMARHGTTTVEIKSGYGLNTASELKILRVIEALRRMHAMTIVPTFLGAHAFPPEHRANPEDYITSIIHEMLPELAHQGLARFCDVFCEQKYFSVEDSRRILQAARKLGLGIKVHADQLSASGAVELAVELGAISADHLECTTACGVQALASSRTIATLLPGAAFFLHHSYPPARALIDAGCAVGLATDFNPGSSMTFSMPMMLTLASTQMQMSPEEAITAATLNGAAALGLAHERGSLEVGKCGDIVLYNVPDYRYIACHYAHNHVSHVFINGNIVL